MELSMPNIFLLARIILFAIGLGPVVHASLTPRHNAEVSLVHEFPKPTWLENLAVMENGSVLVTEMTTPRLWLIDPFRPASSPAMVHEFPGYLGCLGIVETSRNTFAVVTGNFSFDGPEAIPGSFSVWSVDFGSPSPESQVPEVRKVVDVVEAAFLNGISYLGPDQNALFLADSTLGLVFRLDLDTSTVEVAVQDPLMRKCSRSALEGINGMKVFNGYLYFTNAYCGFLAKLPIHENGSAKGKSSIIAFTDVPGKFIFDDFAINHFGLIYAASGNENCVTEVWPGGRKLNIAGNLNSTEIAEPTAMAFGRTVKDRHVLYVTTGGGMGAPINGTAVVGGQLVAITLDPRTY